VADVSFWGEAEMRGGMASTALVANDPKRAQHRIEILQCSGYLCYPSSKGPDLRTC